MSSLFSVQEGKQSLGSGSGPSIDGCPAAVRLDRSTRGGGDASANGPPRGVLRRGLGLLLAIGFLLPFMSLAGTDADEFEGARLIDRAVFLQTGGGAVILRTNLPWTAPVGLSHPALVFAVGFATDERVAPGEFFDSLSVTVRSADGSFVAPALTADVLGLTAGPANPEGTQFNPGAVQPESLGFPPLGSNYQSQGAFLVLVELPPTLAGRQGVLSLALFDNLDQERSVGFVNHLTVVPGPGTPMALESSAQAAGPYAVEGAIQMRHARRCLIGPLPGAHRFFRLEGTAESRITRLEDRAGEWIFSFTGGGTVPPALLSSAQADGPYASEMGVRFSSQEGTLRLTRNGFARFYRIRCEVPLTIRRADLRQNNLLIRYDPPQP